MPPFLHTLGSSCECVDSSATASIAQSIGSVRDVKDIISLRDSGVVRCMNSVLRMISSDSSRGEALSDDRRRGVKL